MTTIISGSSPSITFSDSTTQTTAFTSTPSVTSITTSADASINGLTVGRGAGSVSNNTAVGASALAANTTGSSNTAVGASAGASITTNSYLSALGYQAAYYMTDSNDAFGRQALYGQSGATGYYNCGFGNRALYALTTGNSNVAIGTFSLQANTTGSYNFAGGYQSLFNNTTASQNTAVGYQAGYTNTTGFANVFIGYQAGYTSNAPGTGVNLGYNTCVGPYAGYGLTTGVANCFIGSSIVSGPSTYGAGQYVTTGSYNTILGGYNGNQGGLDIRTASNYVVLSDGAGNLRGVFDSSGRFLVGTAAYVHNSISITSVNANDAQYVTRNSTTTSGNNWRFGADSSNSYQIVNQSAVGVKVTDGATSWSSVSDERLKDIIEPITDASNKVSTLRAVIGKYKTDEEGTRRSFLIAQDVQAVFPEAIDSSNLDELSLRYSEVIPLLVAAFKELKASTDAVKAEFDAYKSTHP